jgi:anthranilate synthase component 1
MLFRDLTHQTKFEKISPVVRHIAYDILTPILAYTNLGGVNSVLMESAYDEGYGQYSFIGINPLATFRAVGQDITIDYDNHREQHLADPYILLAEFSQGRKVFGFISYDGVRLKEQIPDRHPPKDIPDFFFRLYKTVICFDHQQQQLSISHEGSQEDLDLIEQKLFTNLYLAPVATDIKCEFTPDISDEEFATKVRQAQHYIRQGDIFQVVLSRTFSAQVNNLSPFALYRALRRLNPTPYLYLFEEDDFAIAGASPELLVGVKNGVIETVPIAGTCKKGDDINQLLADPKETSEHIMLVDLARNDIGAVAQIGSVQVPKFKHIKTYSHLSHIVSQVIGKLAPEYNQFSALKSVLPAGTLSGAPKIRAMEIIDELENSRRGLYGGAVVCLDEDGNMTSAIAIRTLFIQNKRIELRTGAGIVYDSIPEKEVAETYLKALGSIASIELALAGKL